MEEKTKKRIISKLLGMAVVRIIRGEEPKLTNSEFRFILGEYGIRYKEWFRVLKELRSEKIVEFKKFYVYIFPEAVTRAYYEKYGTLLEKPKRKENETES